MNLFKIVTIAVIAFNILLIPIYLIMLSRGFPWLDWSWTFYYIICYAGAVSLIILTCFLAVRIRSGFTGTQLRIGKRHLHEGTVGIVFVLIGVIWNLWHWFDQAFQAGFFYTIGWWLSVGGLVWIVLGAILIGRDWEDIKRGRFFNKEEY